MIDRQDVKSLFQYWLHTEVHVFSFSIAANALLSFYPFLLMMVWLCRHVLGWPAAEEALYVALRDYFPGETGAFLARNLPVDYGRGAQGFEWASMFLLLFTANGIFMPLEVALNRAWGVREDRPFWKNQLVSTALIFGCGVLTVISMAFTAMNTEILRRLFGGSAGFLDGLVIAVFKGASLPITILVLLIVYWQLPNIEVSWRSVLPTAVQVGIWLEVLKWVSLLVTPWLFVKLSREYGVFKNSVTILLWSFLAGMVVLAGAEASARRGKSGEQAGTAAGAGI